MNRLGSFFGTGFLAVVAACAAPPAPPGSRASAPPPVASIPVPPPVVGTEPEGAEAEPAGGEWREVEYSDLVVPGGFTFEEERSYTFMQEGARMADLYYTGDMAPADAAAFFLRGLPAAGWKLKRFSGLATKVLTFEKGREEALISVTPRRDSTQLRIMVHSRTP